MLCPNLLVCQPSPDTLGLGPGASVSGAATSPGAVSRRDRERDLPRHGRATHSCANNCGEMNLTRKISLKKCADLWQTFLPVPRRLDNTLEIRVKSQRDGECEMPECMVVTRYGQTAQLAPVFEIDAAVPKQDTRSGQGSNRAAKLSAGDPPDSQWVATL